MDLGIEGRVALVCGASSGLGLAVARELAAEGARVAVNSRDLTRLRRAAKAIERDLERTVSVFPTDVSVPERVAAMVAEVVDKMGGLHVLFCNAGGPPATTFSDAPEESWQKALDLNLLSTIHLCRAAVPHMRAARWGRIICLTSIAAKQPLPNLILSSTSRAGVLGFAKCLANEVARDGITVNVVCPGYIATDRTKQLFGDPAKDRTGTAQRALDGLLEQVPSGRMGKPQEVAAAVAFLASERASYITGSAVQVDGGFIRSIV